jgi:hypothetical protein
VTRDAPAAVAALVLGLAAGVGATGCTGALYSRRDVTAGQPLAARESVVTAGTKAEVLAVLGPPGEVLPLAEGDLFIYRLRSSRWRVFDLHTGLVGAPRLSLYADLEGSDRDEALSVRFDREGRVLDVATTRGRAP